MAILITPFIILIGTLSFAEHHTTDGAKETPADSKTDASKPSEPVATKSGLIYTELKAGTGTSPKRTNRVKVHYTGSYEDGRVFDSSVERGKPATFSLHSVISCWTEALQLRKVGGKAKHICPPKIAYGARGRPPRIPPNSTLHFEVELLAIQ